jgi:hypothetical protein
MKEGKVLPRPHWRFEDLEIWQLASGLAVKFHRVAALAFSPRRIS